eukprot:tig00000144_g9095.t1
MATEASKKRLGARMGGSIAMDLMSQLHEEKKKVSAVGKLHEVDADGSKLGGDLDVQQKAERVADKKVMLASGRSNSIKLALMEDLEKQKRAIDKQEKIPEEEEEHEHKPAIGEEIVHKAATIGSLEALALGQSKGGAGARRASLAAGPEAEAIVGNVFFREKRALSTKWVAKNVLMGENTLDELNNHGERRALFELREVYEVERKPYAGFAYALKLKAAVEGKERKFVLGTDDQRLFEAFLARLYAKRRTGAVSTSTRAA